MSRLVPALVVLAALVFPWGARACGVCATDKIASCYDHAVVSEAKARGHEVAFFAIEGDLVREASTRRTIARAIESLPGVRRGSGRVSLENAALSFAFDPAKTSLAAAERELTRRLGARGLGLALLRVL